jgi:hypothetical protein
MIPQTFGYNIRGIHESTVPVAGSRPHGFPKWLPGPDVGTIGAAISTFSPDLGTRPVRAGPHRPS